MYKRILCASALILGMAAAAPPVRAQMLPCGARDAIVTNLGEKYGETRRGGGLAGPTAVVEVYASEKTGTWTILRTGTNGLSCVMAVGEGWQSDAAALTPAGDPA
jgi:hypothetical protein